MEGSLQILYRKPGSKVEFLEIVGEAGEQERLEEGNGSPEGVKMTVRKRDPPGKSPKLAVEVEPIGRLPPPLYEVINVDVDPEEPNERSPPQYIAIQVEVEPEAIEPIEPIAKKLKLD
jgi:hypothetical protein